MSDIQNSGLGFSVSNGVDTSNFGVNQLQDLFGIVKSKLQQAASNPSFLAEVFGDKANTVEFQSVIGQWQVGVFSQLPTIQVISAADMNGADGAYASSTQKIYLSDALFQSSAAPVNSVLGLAGVLTEETFHWLDDRVGTDTQGDEGELARNIVFGVQLSAAELTQIRTEDDRGFIKFGSETLLVEQAVINGNTLNNVLTGTSYDDSIYGFAGDDILSGGHGNDYLNGGDGNDVLDGGFGFDYIDGGNGIDTVTYNFYSEGINLNLRTGVVSFPRNSTLTDTVINIENVVGSSGNDALYGNSLNNTINGNWGNDILDAYGHGISERDTLFGGSGSDLFILGDIGTAYYSRNGTADFVAIGDFRSGEDNIRLKRLSNLVTSASQAYGYRLINVGSSTEIRLDNNELIATLAGVTNLNLTSSTFQFVGTVPNIAPTSLQFNLNTTSLRNTDTLSINNAWVYDGNGASDLSRVDFRIKRANGTFLDVADVTTFVANTSDNRWAGFNYSLSLSSLNLASGNYSLWSVAYDRSGAASAVVEKAFTLMVPTSPDLVITGQTATSAITVGNTVSINASTRNIGNATAGASTTRYWLSNDTVLDSSDISLGSQAINSLAANASQSASFNFTYNSVWGTGTKYIFFQADGTNVVAEGNETNNTAFSTIVVTASSSGLSFSSFSIFDAAGDSTSKTIFQGGAIQLSYSLASAASLSSVRLEALGNGSTINLGSWTGASLSNSLINLNNFSTLIGGNYQFRAVARNTSGQDFVSSTESINILSWNQSSSTTYGTFAGETLNYSAALGAGHVVVGRGGTDTLNLSGISRSSVTSINGVSLGAFNPTTSTNQAIFRGTAFDYLTLSDGREIYFQGIENLRFSDNSTLELQVRTNDTYYKDQWNLRVSDVDSAWRFTQGSSGVLLVSLDSGILTASGASGGINDISTGRLITDATDDDNYKDYGHGHSATSVMGSNANNGYGIAGINWNSSVYMTDVYSGVSLQKAIQDAISYARARGQRVVFQGGIQGESWLNSGGTQAQLEKLIRDNADIAIFAVAAGNGYRDIDDTSIKQQDRDAFPNTTSAIFSGGVARLQTTHSNVMSVGALARSGQSTVNGLANATSVNKASYSNYGSSLTLMAATDSPAMNKFGEMQYFGGTSCANPNMAGITSLVWSVNSNLNGGQLRQILIDTAMDLGTAGRDNTFGNGLVNADAAVRRALALSRNSQLANLYSGRSQFA